MPVARGIIPITQALRVILKTGRNKFVPAQLEGLTSRAPILTMVCPQCGNNLSVEEDKQVTFRILNPAQTFVWADGMPDKNEASVTVRVPFKCPHPAQAGKGMCGIRMVIKGNRVERV